MSIHKDWWWYRHNISFKWSYTISHSFYKMAAGNHFFFFFFLKFNSSQAIAILLYPYKKFDDAIWATFLLNDLKSSAVVFTKWTSKESGDDICVMFPLNNQTSSVVDTSRLTSHRNIYKNYVMSRSGRDIFTAKILNSFTFTSSLQNFINRCSLGYIDIICLTISFSRLQSRDVYSPSTVDAKDVNI